MMKMNVETRCVFQGTTRKKRTYAGKPDSVRALALMVSTVAEEDR